MNTADFDHMLEARLDEAWQPIAAAPVPRGRHGDRSRSRLRYAIRVPALLATPVLAGLAVVVVAGASTVAKTVVTGTPSPLVWTSHAVGPTSAPAPAAPRPGTSSGHPGGPGAAAGRGDSGNHAAHGGQGPAKPPAPGDAGKPAGGNGHKGGAAAGGNGADDQGNGGGNGPGNDKAADKSADRGNGAR